MHQNCVRLSFYGGKSMDLMKKEVIVLNATQYQMTDTETGEINEGTSVRYAFRKYGSKQVLSFQFLALSKLALYIPSSDNVSQ